MSGFTGAGRGVRAVRGDCAGRGVRGAVRRLESALLLVLGAFGLLGLLGVLGQPLGEGAGLASAVTFAATAAVGSALAACLVLAARSARPVPPHRIRTAMRDREQRTAFLPQRDPDAAGRSRPRAPGRRSLTAA
ncbi:DUF6412 domain-containing protein [Streptomyces bambusae]|uniref:DUF6412 domain-containing protein n=1 Tax=Streptomyces bambusae TaxID=1550616 RepID=UPI001CFEE699|nr:DUF6412 domain-containing protein [Streptomyces bambusae]MCB5167226.1 DUF6412 domain-containing protein [Streptomyces bambusae]